MKKDMKLKKVFSKSYNHIALFIIGGCVLLILIIYGSTELIVKLAAPHSYTFGPLESLTINHPLDTQIYFNNIVGEAKILGIVKDQIDQAKYSIEIAMFSFESDKIKDALYAANKRGVKITLVLDKSRSGQHDLFLPDLPSSIKRIDAGSYDVENPLNTTYMHDKFMIVDRGRPSESLVTGSLNFTELGEKYNQSFLLVTKESAIVSAYEKEFDLLKEGVSGIKKIGTGSYDPWAASIQYSDSFIDIWFSPGFSDQSLKYQVLNLINSSKQSIDIIMWDFTDKEIAKALIKKADEGVKVRIITEAKRVDTRDSSIPFLQLAAKSVKNNNLEIILDTKLVNGVKDTLPDDFTPLIHHHSMIVDGKTLVLGSGNWSLYGFYENDENAFITNNSYLISESQKTFNHFYDVLK
jgi:phosphatidylserine/phosphatidylglycerophosphate/cardiolipin synthase-like enzyme